ncbi:hypothetical protein [Oscillibacter valericigenes]|uniref:hypothetical protein n=1 Tax=Oscillibacter valericigenes TaxID=351091 RepID=UPI00195A8E0D|nr:hypothetical protein [Oscillibacter valericigenes]
MIFKTAPRALRLWGLFCPFFRPLAAAEVSSYIRLNWQKALALRRMICYNSKYNKFHEELTRILRRLHKDESDPWAKAKKARNDLPKETARRGDCCAHAGCLLEARRIPAKSSEKG